MIKCITIDTFFRQKIPIKINCTISEWVDNSSSLFDPISRQREKMLTLSSLLLSMYLLLCIVNKKVQDSQTSPNVSIEVAKRLLSRKGCVAAGDSKDCVSDKLSTRPRSTPQWMVAFSEEAAMHTKLSQTAK